MIHHESAYAFVSEHEERGLMAPVALIPVTLRSVKHTLQQLGYVLVEDDGRILIWKKVGPVPSGLEEVAKAWPLVVSKQYPLFTAEGHDLRVYDRSDVTDLIVEITGRARTDGARIVAMLRSETLDPDLPAAHIINLLCKGCGARTRVDRYSSTLKEIFCKCPHCGHEETRRI